MTHTLTTAAALPVPAAARSVANSAWWRFRRHKLALLGLAVLMLFGLLALFAEVVAQRDPNRVDIDQLKAPPSVAHILGTDAAGRDVFARLVYGARVSMLVGLTAVLLSSVIGTFMGLVSGYAGGWVDNALMRFTELIQTFPTFFAVILLVALIGPNILNVILVIGVLGWTGLARLVRGQVLALREADYVLAAHAVGVPGSRILARHILPGVLPYVMVAATLGLASAILTEAALSFLGLGVRMPTSTWGNMLNAAQSLPVLEGQPWLWLPPGLALGLTILSVNFVGDGLRDALDPRMNIR